MTPEITGTELNDKFLMWSATRDIVAFKDELTWDYDPDGFEAAPDAPSASRRGSSRRGCTGVLEASSIATEAASANRGARTISSNGSTAARSISYEAA